GKGEKMSKSIGNTVSPLDVMKKYGADILRLWTATIDYQADVRISDDILKQVAEQYRKVRNTFRFLLANLSDFNADQKVEANELSLANQILLARLHEVNEKVQAAYASYDFSAVTMTLTNFMTNDLSAYYLDYTKDILYIENATAQARVEVQSVLYEVLRVLNTLWAPILVHTMDEVYETYQSEGSVHLQSFVTTTPLTQQETLLQDFDTLMELRADVFKALELARNEKVIGKSLEAEVLINASAEHVALFNKYFPNALAQWLIVSNVRFTEDLYPAYEYLQVQVQACPGAVCPRCWNVSTNDHEDHLCERCESILQSR
ncbi:MAG: class I tRNA ligase family protein, partial [Erysipelotrichaceae bacterium]